MFDTIVVASLSQAVDLFFDGWYNPVIDRYRSDYAFRGVHSAEYSLVSSFSRNCSDQWDLEHNILRNFSKYAEMEAPFMVQSVWKQMILGQHYGLPTRLLDWTYSPPHRAAFRDKRCRPGLPGKQRRGRLEGACG
ncbi:MAG: FRG domain-containing protein [Christensenellales bacterium]